MDKTKSMHKTLVFARFIPFTPLSLTYIKDSGALFLIVIARADAELLGKAAGEVFGIVEANLIGDLGDIAVASLSRKQFLGHVQTVVL